MIVCLSPNGRTEHASAHPPTRLLVGTVYGVALLERAAPGARWEAGGHSLAGRHVSALLYEPICGGVFASVHGSGLFASADGGRTWTRRTSGLAHEHVWTLACRERDGVVELYAGTQPAHLYRSTDYGASWEEIPGILEVAGQERWMFPPPPHQPHVKSVAFDPTDPEVLDGYYAPTDLFYKDMHRVVLSPADPRRIYLATGDGLYASQDGGETWEHLCAPGSSLVGYPDGLLLAPGDDRTLFMAGGAAAP